MRLLRKRVGKPHPYLATLGDRFAASDFKDRMVPRYPAASTPASQETRPAAEATDPPASAAAFSHFTESSFALCASAFAEATADTSEDVSCAVAAHSQDQTAPAPPAKECAGAVAFSRDAIHLPDHAMVLVRAISAYENCSNQRAVMLAIAHYGKRIGAGPLARAIFDISADGDLADMPDVPRAAANRFRSA